MSNIVYQGKKYGKNDLISMSKAVEDEYGVAILNLLKTSKYDKFCEFAYRCSLKARITSAPKTLAFPGAKEFLEEEKQRVMRYPVWWIKGFITYNDRVLTWIAENQ